MLSEYLNECSPASFVSVSYRLVAFKLFPQSSWKCRWRDAQDSLHSPLSQCGRVKEIGHVSGVSRCDRPWVFKKEPVVKSVINWQSPTAIPSGFTAVSRTKLCWCRFLSANAEHSDVLEQSRSCSDGKSVLWGSPSSWLRPSQSSRATWVSSYPTLHPNLFNF